MASFRTSSHPWSQSKEKCIAGLYHSAPSSVFSLCGATIPLPYCSMQGMRDESIWKNLALAFGDGLAFGVGVKLSQDAAARIAPGRTDVRTLAERLTEIEHRIEKARQNNALPTQFN